MAVTTPDLKARLAPAASADRRDARYQAFALLWMAFAVAPVAFGLDKFFNIMVDWPIYLAPWIDAIVPGSAQELMYAVGAVEIVAGIAVAVRPRYGAWLVAAWLGAIIVNLLSYPGFYDVALLAFGLLVGAGILAGLDDGADRKITFRRRRRADADRFVRLANVERIGVGVGINRDGAYSHPSAGANHPTRDLAPIGDQDLGERRFGAVSRQGRFRGSSLALFHCLIAGRTSPSHMPRGRQAGRPSRPSARRTTASGAS